MQLSLRSLSTDRITILASMVALLLFGVLTVFTPSWVPLTLTLTLFVVMVLMSRPIYALYLFAMSIPFDRIPLFTIGGSAFSASKIMGGLLIMIWLLQLLSSKRRPRSMRSQLPPTLTAFLVIYTVWSTIATIESTISDGFSLNVWFALVVPFCIPFTLFHFLTDIKKLMRFWQCYAGVMIFSCVVGWFQFFTGAAPFGLSRTISAYIGTTFLGFRPSGTLDDPNYYALATSVTFGIWLIAYQRETHPSRRTWYGFLTIFCAASILSTLSRGGIAGLAVIIVVFIWQAPDRFRNLLVFGAISAVGALVFANSPLFDAILLRFGDSAAALGRGRQVIWLDYIQAIRDNPLFGEGIYQAQDLYRASHNLLLGISAERGIIAGIAMVGILITMAPHLTRRIQMPADQVIIRSTMLAVFVGYVVQSMFLQTENQKELWFLVGTVFVLFDQYRQSSVQLVPNPRNRSFSQKTAYTIPAAISAKQSPRSNLR